MPILMLDDNDCGVGAGTETLDNAASRIDKTGYSAYSVSLSGSGMPVKYEEEGSGGLIISDGGGVGSVKDEA